ncbi:proteasome regulatory protein [Theileria orientalis]|uniref:Proteasome regulatory protein n=1 Tax=Theileria orientalis TaxID=68886 RepID=A0A976XIQ8_THEOR|nr:proteasome regulatory protein [Theileria orientalis]
MYHYTLKSCEIVLYVMADILELDKKRKNIELEMEALMDYLHSDECKNVGLKGALVDKEEFPRDDIDIYAVRKARGRVTCLKNDYERLTEEIERKLHELHSDYRKNNTG